MSKSALRIKGLLEAYRSPIAFPSYTHTPFLRNNVIGVSNKFNRWCCSSSSSSSSSAGGVMAKRSSGFPQVPWLFFSPADDGKIIPAFNPSDSCFYNIPIPKEVQGPYNSVRGSGHGWLVMVKSNDYDYDRDEDTKEMIVSLYNPITRAHIPLPSLPYIPPNIVGSAKLWRNPSKASPGQPLVSIMYGLVNQQMLIYVQGEDEWRTDIVTEDFISSTVYHEADATLYVAYHYGELSVLDLESWTLKPLIDASCPELTCEDSPRLVVGAAGDLLMVVGVRPEHERPHYDVYQLDRKCLEWVRTTNIGDHTLFVHDNHMVSNIIDDDDTLFAHENHMVSMACPPCLTDAQPNQVYIFKPYKTRSAGNRRVEETDTHVTIETPADVQVLDLTEAAANSPDGEKEQVLFKTSNIIRKPLMTWYNNKFAAWMVPSLS